MDPPKRSFLGLLFHPASSAIGAGNVPPLGQKAAAPVVLSAKDAELRDAVQRHSDALKECEKYGVNVNTTASYAASTTSLANMLSPIPVANHSVPTNARMTVGAPEDAQTASAVPTAPVNSHIEAENRALRIQLEVAQNAARHAEDRRRFAAAARPDIDQFDSGRSNLVGANDDENDMDAYMRNKLAEIHSARHAERNYLPAGRHLIGGSADSGVDGIKMIRCKDHQSSRDQRANIGGSADSSTNGIKMIRCKDHQSSRDQRANIGADADTTASIAKPRVIMFRCSENGHECPAVNQQQQVGHGVEEDACITCGDPLDTQDDTQDDTMFVADQSSRHIVEGTRVCNECHDRCQVIFSDYE